MLITVTVIISILIVSISVWCFVILKWFQSMRSDFNKKIAEHEDVMFSLMKNINLLEEKVDSISVNETKNKKTSVLKKKKKA